jgi:ankyrin repeat protein
MVWNGNAFYKINRELKMLMSGNSKSDDSNREHSFDYDRSNTKAEIKLHHMNSVEYYFWMNAVIKADISTIQTYIDNGINVDEVRHRDHPALLLATSRGYTSVVKLLLEGGADLNSRTDNTRSTALHLATERNHTGIVKLLLEYGVDKNAIDEEGKTALIIAAQKGFLEVVKLLVPNEDYKEPILELLFDRKYQRKRNTEYITEKSKSVMLRNKANINIRDRDGTTALMYSIIHGNFQDDRDQLKLVKWLLDHEANPNMQDIYGITALIFATVGRYANVINLLLNYGADVNMKNISGDTALFYAKGDEKIIGILKEAGAKE